MNYYEDYEINRLPCGCERTILGDLQGADAQYRCPNGMHVREYGDQLIAHRDKIDPRDDLLGHLLIDAPIKTAVATGVAVAVLATMSGKSNAVTVGATTAVVVLALAALMS